MTNVFSVSEFISSINDIIAGEFVIEGEIAQYKVSQGKWIFFDLKDEGVSLSCFSTLYMLPAPLEDGMRVQVVGYPKIHDKSGRFSFTVQKVVPVGVGALQRAYVLLKEKLTSEGIFNPERKRLLRELPSRIGVIASRDSAAFGDFKRIINGRWGGLEIVLCHVTVQGETAVGEIVQAFEEFARLTEPCEVIVLIRGGGSLEDLAAFNSEEVVRAIYRSPTPVVTGVGHERDETLADFAADVRAATPTHAAQLVVPERKEFLKNMQFELESLGDALLHQLRLRRQLLENSGMVFSYFFDRSLREARLAIDRLARGHYKLVSLIEERRQQVLQAQKTLLNLSPRQILARGYCIARDHEGKIIRQAKSVDSGAKIVLELGTGEITTIVI